jgi:purine-binding chemotaxis protein CheW
MNIIHHHTDQGGVPQAQKTEIVQLSTFWLAQELFGVNALHVQEILPYQEITPVPLAPDYLKGLINLRGQIITVIDLRRKLGFPSFEAETTATNLIVNSGDGALSLLVDQIANVVDMHSDQLATPPGTIRGIAVQYIQAVCQLEGQLLIVLDIDRVLQVE